MRLIILISIFLCFAAASLYTTRGIEELVKRRLPNHVDFFTFRLTQAQTMSITSVTNTSNDKYTVTTTPAGKILIEGNSPIALATGLRRYLTDIVHVDIWWTVGSLLDVGEHELPLPAAPLTGASIVPWRYHFNPVTFSYTTVFWHWEEWELELDWLALHGVNLPLALVGQEKVLIDVFREVGLADSDIMSFLSGPAYQAWNRMGNIQDSWGGNIPHEWIEDQFELQKKITTRMVDLGMTPILPAFTNFVPKVFKSSFPEASIRNGSEWQKFTADHTNVAFLNPLDPWSARLQKSFLTNQAKALGNISHFYILDQFNENNPASTDANYLHGVSNGTWHNLKSADPDAIWVMQGWLFSKNPTYWTNDRVAAYLGGVDNSSMLILDMFAESKPQWKRTHSYFGKPWIWCQLHGYGGNLGIYGQIMNVTINAIDSLNRSASLVGFGLSMEAQEGNEVIYDLLLDQAWSKNPINTKVYFHEWVRRRYHYWNQIPETPPELYSAWDILRITAYNNTNGTSEAVTKSIFEMSPSIDGMLDRVQHHPTTINYDPQDMISAWKLMFASTETSFWLWEQPAFILDMVDITRQVLSNAFHLEYTRLIKVWSSKRSNASKIEYAGRRLLSILEILDAVVSTHPAFSLSTWIAAARSHTLDTKTADFFEYNAKLQITGWGPNGEINDYASKAWGGLISSYYVPRWQGFIQYLTKVGPRTYNETALQARLREFEVKWQTTKGLIGRPRVSEALPSLLLRERKAIEIILMEAQTIRTRNKVAK